MAGAKRRTPRQKASPSGASTTPTSISTPVFSSRNSVVSETPMTTEVDEEASEHEPPKTRNRARRAAAAQALGGVPEGGRVQKRKAASTVEGLVPNKKKRTTK